MSRRLVWHKDEVKDVVKLLLSCKTEKEIEDVFDHILTPREINDIARRYKVFQMIDEGKSFTEILHETGMSSVTVSRLSQKCGYGFRKSSKIAKPKRKSADHLRRKTIRYKGVPVAKVRG